MSRTYRKLKTKKGKKKQYAHGWNYFHKTVVFREKMTEQEAEDSYFMTVIKGGVRQKVEIKEMIWGGKRLLTDTRSGVNNLPHMVRKLKEKQYRQICKSSLQKAIQRDELEDYAPEDLKIVDAAWSWW